MNNESNTVDAYNNWIEEVNSSLPKFHILGGTVEQTYIIRDVDTEIAEILDNYQQYIDGEMDPFESANIAVYTNLHLL